MAQLTFDEVFKIWMDAEVSSPYRRDTLPVAKEKGFNSITEWRLATALRLGMDKKDWTLETIDNPGEALLNIIVGPYPGWSKFFNNQLTTTFAQAMEIPEFFEWCKTHDRIVPYSENFPFPTTLILFRKPDGKLICIEGGHRVCAVAFANKLGKPISFDGKPPVTAAIANVAEEEIVNMVELIKLGTAK